MGKQEVSLFTLEKKVPDYIKNDDIGDDGNESVSADDLVIPQLKIMQGLSPEMMSIPGAAPGKLFDSNTMEQMDSVLVVNLGYEHNYTIWKKRELGGGREGVFTNRSEAAAAMKALPGDINDYQMQDTGIHHLLGLDEQGEPTTPYRVFCGGTKKSFSNKWNTDIQVRCKGMPRYSGVWRVGTTQESNKRGSWHGYKVEFAGYAPEKLYNIAKEMRSSIMGEQPAAIAAD